MTWWSKGNDILEVIYHNRPLVLYRVDKEKKLVIAIFQVLDTPEECWTISSVRAGHGKICIVGVEPEPQLASASACTAVISDACT